MRLLLRRSPSSSTTAGKLHSLLRLSATCYVCNMSDAGEMLQLPDQTYDVLISFANGTYYFQCDPHALLGMVGHIRVGG